MKPRTLNNEAVTGYAPWKPPFRYNVDGQWIEDSKGNRMLDMRGWGYLTGKGSEALGMDEDAAAKIQDAIGQRAAELLNADVKGSADLHAVRWATRTTGRKPFDEPRWTKWHASKDAATNNKGRSL